MNKMWSLLKGVMLFSVLFWSYNALAEQGIVSPCSNLPLANKIVAGVKPPIDPNVCVDIPVNLTENHTLFNMDSVSTSDGTAAGAPNGLRHMYMLGKAMQARVATGKMSKDDIQIIGIMHGSAVHWALSDAWWQSQYDEDGKQLYPDGNPYKDWIEKLFALNNAGIPIQLETCGVTLSGAGLSSDDVYSSPNGRIYVNQGAIGRIIDLQQQGYAYYQEGWVDNDSKKKD